MRYPRSYKPGHIYHIIQRGNNHEFIFDADAEKRHFLSILQKIISEMPCQILHYVIMNNHYHLLIQMQDIPLHKIMQRVNLRYTLYYNRQNHRTGTVFSKVMVAIDVNDLGYLHTLIAYIANNPVRAEIVSDPKAYHWSAHNNLLTNRRSFIAKDQLYALIAPDSAPKDAQTKYRQIVDAHNHAKPISQATYIRNKRSAELRSIFEKLKQLSNQCENDPELIREFIPMALDSGYTINEIMHTIRIPPRTLKRILARCRIWDAVPNSAHHFLAKLHVDFESQSTEASTEASTQASRRI